MFMTITKFGDYLHKYMSWQEQKKEGMKEFMGDLFSTNCDLVIMRHEHIKTVAQANIQARNIRILELNEEIARCKTDIDAQIKVIEEADKNISIHKAAKAKEKA